MHCKLYDYEYITHILKMIKKAMEQGDLKDLKNLIRFFDILETIFIIVLKLKFTKFKQY